MFGVWTIVCQLLLYTTTRRATVENIENTTKEQSCTRAWVTCPESCARNPSFLLPDPMFFALHQPPSLTMMVEIETDLRLMNLPFVSPNCKHSSLFCLQSWYRPSTNTYRSANLALLRSKLSHEHRMLCLFLKEMSLEARTGPLLDFQYSGVVKNIDLELDRWDGTRSSDAC